MPLPSSLIGIQSPEIEHQVDARWLMAYAGGIDDANPRYLDTTQTLACHPVFPVCLEWPAILASRDGAARASLTTDEASRGVHAGHDLVIHRLPRADERVATQATTVSVSPSRAGAVQVLRLDTKSTGGELLCQTWQTSIFRGVDVEGDASAIDQIPARPQPEGESIDNVITRAVPTQAAHVYTECARIWNPIHTDRAVAQAAGLDDIILHGTATLAYAITEIVNRYAGAKPSRVKRLGGDFRAQVFMPSTIGIRMHDRTDDNGEGLVTFSVATSDGEDAIRSGYVVLAGDSADE